MVAAQGVDAAPPARRERFASRALWRAVIVVAALAAPLGELAAQTVIVRHGPPGGGVEVVLNAATVGTATGDANGHATVVVRESGPALDERAVFVFVDVCEASRRVVLLERGRTAPPLPSGCSRQEMSGVFILRSAGTLVVDLSAARPRLLLRQGAFDPDAPPRVWEESPTGLLLFGGGGLTRISSAGVESCGTAPVCEHDGMGLGWLGGATFWIKPFLAVESSLIAPKPMVADGSGEGYRFSSTLDLSVVTVSGVAGIPTGPVRIYGKGGLNYQRALLTTDQTIDSRIRVVEDVEETIPGATQVFQRRQGGYSWHVGVGLEFWANRWVGVFGEFTTIKLKGSDLDGGESLLDDRLMTFVVGGRVRIGR